MGGGSQVSDAAWGMAIAVLAWIGVGASLVRNDVQAGFLLSEWNDGAPFPWLRLLGWMMWPVSWVVPVAGAVGRGARGLYRLVREDRRRRLAQRRAPELPPRTGVYR